MFVVTSKQMYQVECNAVNRELTFPRLMENAGASCARIIRDRFNVNGNNILVLCGRGKNGGDGFVIARKLFEAGCRVTVMLVCGEPKAQDAADMLEMIDNGTVRIVAYNNSLTSVEEYIDEAEIIVDCIFGTGFDGVLPQPVAQLVKVVNATKAKRVSVDVPSGALSDSAKVPGDAIRADLTVAISAYKPIHIMKPFSEFCGECALADIGIIAEDFRALNSLICFTCDDNDIAKLLPKRKTVSNKGTYGHVLSICGSTRMQGAAVLAASGALRSGCGLVTAAFPSSAYPAIASKLTEPLLMPLEPGLDGTLTITSLPKLLDTSAHMSAVLLGCGLGFNPDTEKLVHSLVRKCTKPLVLDADGINALAGNIDILKEVRSPVVLTPHPGEMSRLCGKSVGEIVLNPIQTAVDFALKYNVTVVLKGANTVVCTPDPINVYINRTGNTGLSKGGSGDLLAGMLASFMAQGMSPFDASIAAVYLHGKCADITASRLSQRGMLPSDLLTYLPELLSNFE